MYACINRICSNFSYTCEKKYKNLLSEKIPFTTYYSMAVILGFTGFNGLKFGGHLNSITSDHGDGWKSVHCEQYLDVPVILITL